MRNVMNPELRELITAVLKAMAHPTRLLLLEALSEGEKCVCELAPMTSADLSTVSKHLSVLKGAGLVKSRKQNLNVYYSLAQEQTDDIIGAAKDLVAENCAGLMKAVR